MKYFNLIVVILFGFGFAFIAHADTTITDEELTTGGNVTSDYVFANGSFMSGVCHSNGDNCSATSGDAELIWENDSDQIGLQTPHANLFNLSDDFYFNFTSGALTLTGNTSSPRKIDVSGVIAGTIIGILPNNDLNGAVLAGIQAQSFGSGNTGELRFMNKISGTLTEMGRFDQSGGFGVNTQNPTHRINVNGTGNISGVTYLGSLFTSSVGNTTHRYSWDELNATGGTDTNDTAWIGNFTGVNCPSGNYSIGAFSNGTIECEDLTVLDGDFDYNFTVGTEFQYGLWWYNQSLWTKHNGTTLTIANITNFDFNYNQTYTDGTFNSTYEEQGTKWLNDSLVMYINSSYPQILNISDNMQMLDNFNITFDGGGDIGSNVTCVKIVSPTGTSSISVCD